MAVIFKLFVILEPGYQQQHKISLGISKYKNDQCRAALVQVQAEDL